MRYGQYAVNSELDARKTSMYLKTCFDVTVCCVVVQRFANGAQLVVVEHHSVSKLAALLVRHRKDFTVELLNHQ